MNLRELKETLVQAIIPSQWRQQSTPPPLLKPKFLTIALIALVSAHVVLFSILFVYNYVWNTLKVTDISSTILSAPWSCTILGTATMGFVGTSLPASLTNVTLPYAISPSITGIYPINPANYTASFIPGATLSNWYSFQSPSAAPSSVSGLIYVCTMSGGHDGNRIYPGYPYLADFCSNILNGNSFFACFSPFNGTLTILGPTADAVLCRNTRDLFMLGSNFEKYVLTTVPAFVPNPTLVSTLVDPESRPYFATYQSCINYFIENICPYNVTVLANFPNCLPNSSLCLPNASSAGVTFMFGGPYGFVNLSSPNFCYYVQSLPAGSQGYFVYYSDQPVTDCMAAFKETWCQPATLQELALSACSNLEYLPPYLCTQTTRRSILEAFTLASALAGNILAFVLLVSGLVFRRIVKQSRDAPPSGSDGDQGTSGGETGSYSMREGRHSSYSAPRREELLETLLSSDHSSGPEPHRSAAPQ